MEGSWEGKRRRNIKYARTDAWSHSSLPFLYRFRSFQYLFPLNVSSSPRFPPRNHRANPSASLSPCLYPVVSVPSLQLSPSYCAFLAPIPPSRSPLDRPLFFFLSLSCNYSLHCCMRGYIRTLAWGIFFYDARAICLS